MSNVNLGRTIERIIGKIRKDANSKVSEKTDAPPKNILLKAIPLNDFSDIDKIKVEINSGNILIIKVTPLAEDHIDDVRRVITELCEFVSSINGDIARLGEERIVVTPESVKIWREKIDDTENT